MWCRGPPLSAFTASYFLLWLLVAASFLLVVALLRHIGGLELRVEELSRTVGQTRVSRIDRSGLAPGSPAPELRLRDATGRAVRFSAIPGRRAVVVLTQPGCGPCELLLPELGDLAKGPDAPAVFVITKGMPGTYPAPPGVSVLYQRGAEAMVKFQAFATPWVFVIGPSGRIEAQGIAHDAATLDRVLAIGRDALPTAQRPLAAATSHRPDPRGSVHSPSLGNLPNAPPTRVTHLAPSTAPLGKEQAINGPAGTIAAVAE